jgi:hypothetical protein
MLKQFFQNHLLGMSVFAVGTSVLANFVYDYLKNRKLARPAKNSWFRTLSFIAGAIIVVIAAFTVFIRPRPPESQPQTPERDISSKSFNNSKTKFSPAPSDQAAAGPERGRQGDARRANELHEADRPKPNTTVVSKTPERRFYDVVISRNQNLADGTFAVDGHPAVIVGKMPGFTTIRVPEGSRNVQVRTKQLNCNAVIPDLPVQEPLPLSCKVGEDYEYETAHPAHRRPNSLDSFSPRAEHCSSKDRLCS